MNARAVLISALLSSPTLFGQVLISGMEPGGTARLLPSDAAVLDLREPRTSLPCAVKPARPELSFDFAFHAGYEVRVRLRDLAGDGDLLTSIFRVTPENSPDRPLYFEQKWRVPAIEEDASGTASFDGAFSVGEGDYQVDWLMRDRSERFCSAYWRISVRLPVKEGPIPGGLAPGAVVATAGELLTEQEPAKHVTEQPLNVAILLNVGPEAPGRAAISPKEKEVLLSILRGIARDPRIGSMSLTAFNLEQSEVIFQQENTRKINFSGLDEAMKSLNLGTVSVAQLADKNSEARFLTQLAAGHAKQASEDAVIFVGPKTDPTGIGRDLLPQLGQATCPVFYLTYSETPEASPWPDLIGSAVRYWRGRQFNISRPLDLLSAWSKIISQLTAGNPWRRAPVN